MEKSVGNRLSEVDPEQFLALGLDLFLTTTLDGTCLYANQTFSTVLGYDPEEVKGRRIIGFIYPADQAQSLSKLTELGRGMSVLDFENRLVHKNGDHVWIQWRARADLEGGMVYAVGRDISLQMRLDLERNKALLEKTQELGGIGGWELFLDTGKCIWTDEVYKIYGLDYGVDHDIELGLEYYHPDDRDRIREAIEECRTRGKPYDLSLRFTDAKGRDKWVRAIGEPHFEEGKIVRLFGTFQDISEEKMREEKRLAEEKRVLQLQKLEGLGLLAGGVAHEFNNLLVNILANADLVLQEEGSHLPAEVRTSIEEVVSSAEKAAELCRQLLAYAGKETLERRAVDLTTLVGELRHIFVTSVWKNVRAQFLLSDELPAVRGDEAQLRQLVMSLMLNAAESMPGGEGEIVVTTRKTSHFEVLLQVEDTGCGMDEETLERIFDPFFSTKFTGRGLGLSAVRGIVDKHGGRLDVASQVGEGTKVSVYLPISRESSGPTLSPQPSTPDSLILLVDDDPGVLRLNRRILEKAGYSTMPTENGGEALEFLKANHFKVRLVVLDLTMPGMSGEEVYSRMKSHSPDIPIIVSSGYAPDQVLERFKEERPDGLLPKPYRATELTQKIEEVLGR